MKNKIASSKLTGPAAKFLAAYKKEASIKSYWNATKNLSKNVKDLKNMKNVSDKSKNIGNKASDILGEMFGEKGKQLGKRMWSSRVTEKLDKVLVEKAVPIAKEVAKGAVIPTAGLAGLGLANTRRKKNK